MRETEEETGVVLAADELRPWAHWITPESEPRRYDTHFFVGRNCRSDNWRSDLSGETDRAEWTTPEAALAAERAGQIALMPPTLSIMLELADRASMAEVSALGREPGDRVVLPELVRTDDGWRFSYPIGRGGHEDS